MSVLIGLFVSGSRPVCQLTCMCQIIHFILLCLHKCDPKTFISSDLYLVFCLPKRGRPRISLPVETQHSLRRAPESFQSERN